MHSCCVLQKYRGCRGHMRRANLNPSRISDLNEGGYGGDVLVLVLATLAGGFLTCLCAWPWFGLGAILLAPFGAGSTAVFAGLLLAALRSRRPGALTKAVADLRALDVQPEALPAGANDAVAGQRRRA